MDFDPIGSVLGYFGQQETNANQADIANRANDFNAAQAQLNRDYQTQMSNTAYQRQVQDMSAAGLNPMLAYIKGGGASSPSGSTATATVPSYTSPVTGAIQGRLTSAQSAKTEKETGKVVQETTNLGLTASQIQANTELIGNTINKTKAEIGKIQLEEKTLQGGLKTQELDQKRLGVVIENIATETKLLKQRNLSEQQTTKVLTETVTQMHNKSLVSDMELKAILDTNMIGVYAREIKAVTDIGGDFISGAMNSVLRSMPKRIIHSKE
jgi:hypothetical protein